MALNPKQQRFCEEYLIDLNATQASIRAGYDLFLEPGKRYFVYFLIDPRNESIFYIGKGKGKRPYQHFKEIRSVAIYNPLKCQRILEIKEASEKVQIKYFATELSEEEAFSIEGSLIRFLAKTGITNIQSGSTKQTSKEWAAFNLSRITPFDKWVSMQPRTDQQIEIYWMCKNEFERIAREGLITGVFVRNDRPHHYEIIYT
jgi:hypothetical protein